MPRKKKVKTETIEHLTEEIIDVAVEKPEKSSEEKARYVVVRNNRRVSDIDYFNSDDPRAFSERDFWARVVENWSPGEKVEIVLYDKKQHRTY